MPSDADQHGDGTPRTDGGITPAEILEKNRSHGNSDQPPEAYQRDCSSAAARKLITEWVAMHVDEHRIASSSQICRESDRDDVRIQDIGRTLGARRAGSTPAGFLEDIELSVWRDNQPKKWVFDRVAGQKREATRSKQLFQHQLIDEISDTLDADVADAVTPVGDSNSKKIRVRWMRAVVEAIAARRETSIDEIVTGYEPEKWQTQEQYVAQLGKEELTRLLEKLLEADDKLGSKFGWPRSTMILIHDVIVSGVDPAEVDA